MTEKYSEAIQIPLPLRPPNKKFEQENVDYSFPAGTPIYQSYGSLVYAENAFVATKIKDKKIANYPAFKLTATTLVYKQRGFGPKQYFYLKAFSEFGASTSSKSDYRPKKLTK